MRRITIMLLFMFVASHASATERVVRYPSGTPVEVATSADIAGLLSLDQTTPETIINGVPLMTTAVDGEGSGNQLTNKDYVDDNAGISNIDGGASDAAYAAVTASPIDGGDAT